MQTSQQIREMYKKLPQKTREIIASPELAEIINSIAKINNLEKERQDIIAKAVVDFLMNINNKEKVHAVITNDIGIDGMSSQKIFNEVETRILNNLDNIHIEINRNIEAEESEIEENRNKGQKSETPENSNIQPTQQSTLIKPRNNVGQSFEQIILNQAKAMQPARLAGEIPQNLPTENTDKISPPVPNYSNQPDPYREPLE